MHKSTHFIGPVQFRLNQGTAKKWRAALIETDWLFDPSQLSYSRPDGYVYGCQSGILAEIADQNPATGWDGHSRLYDGEQFYISTQSAKRLKLQGSLPDFEGFDDAVYWVDTMASHHGLCVT